MGIHYRGTDKLISEAVRIPYAEALDVLAGLDSRIHFFVATDEQAFLDAMLDRFGRRVIFREQHRSTDGTPIHHFEPDHASLGCIRGKDAILDAILLARCHALIRTVSNLSLASTFMNPNIPELIFPTTAAKNGPVKSIRSIEQAALKSQ
ncbi:MAG: hypothetical protein K9N23_03725 [Akkermansiaceae bacterium]|nr:hypothetical protein [Akkermansiaceae bacterium]